MKSSVSLTNKIGLVLAAVLGAGDIASLGTLGQQLEPGQDGPPAGVTIFSALLGVITLVGVVIAWRSGSRAAVRAVAGTRIVSLLLSLPAFFVSGVPAGWVAITGVAVVLTVVALALILRKPAAAGSSGSGSGADVTRAGAAR